MSENERGRTVIVLMVSFLCGICAVVIVKATKTTKATPVVTKIETAKMPTSFLKCKISDCNDGDVGWVPSHAIIVDDSNVTWLDPNGEFVKEKTIYSTVMATKTPNGWEVIIPKNETWLSRPLFTFEKGVLLPVRAIYSTE